MDKLMEKEAQKGGELLRMFKSWSPFVFKIFWKNYVDKNSDRDKSMNPKGLYGYVLWI